MPRFLVTEATSLAGGAAVEHLLRAGAQVRAVVKDPKTDPEAPALAALGAEVVRGSVEDADAIGHAASGCRGIFLVTQQPTPGAIGGDTDGKHKPEHEQGDLESRQEVQHAWATLAACRAAGTTTAVVCTTAWAGDRDKWADLPDTDLDPSLRSYLEGKAGIEAAVREIFPCCGRDSGKGTNHTILRPGWGNSHYLVAREWAAETGAAELVHWLEPGRRVPHVDEDDIGRWAAAALMDPVVFCGKELELAGDNVTAEEAAEIVSRVSGRTVKSRRWRGVDETPAARQKQQRAPSLRAIQQWASRVDITTEVAIEYEFGIPLTTLEEYLVKHKEALLRSLPA